MRKLVFALLAVPVTALAQPAPPPPPEPAGPPSDPTTVPVGPTAPGPYAPGPYQPGPYQPQPGMAPQPQPMYAPVQQPNPNDPWFFHRGVTFEANVGIGFAHESASFMGMSQTNDSDAALAGADFSVGGWINPQLALVGRVSGVQLKNTTGGTTSPSDGEIVHVFVGPNLQYWPAPNVWIGGGAGLSTLQWIGHNDTDCTGDGCSTNGFGFNLRAGYSFGAGTPHVFNVSVETNTGFYSETQGTNSLSITVTGVSLLAGYQYL